jgi:hypothetical protein
VKPAELSHLADDRLIDVYFAECEVEESVEADETARRHLGACASCARRYQLISEPLERLREQAARAADAVFTNERLSTQRERILRRLEAAEHPARVILFPFASSSRRAGGGVRIMKRWVAAAAAAGLLVGLGLGRLATINSPAVQQAPRASLMAANGAVRAQPTIRPVPGSSNSTIGDYAGDEAFLLALDDAVNRRVSIAELQAIDALTPHVSEASVRVK